MDMHKKKVQKDYIQYINFKKQTSSDVDSKGKCHWTLIPWKKMSSDVNSTEKTSLDVNFEEKRLSYVNSKEKSDNKR